MADINNSQRTCARRL